jgi:hypothetical protein
MAKLTVNDLELRGQRVFVRVDYNVPMEEKDGQMVINDATRIQETLPTLNLLIQKGAKLILAAHLGRPQGQRDPALSLRPIAAKLADLLRRPVAFVDDCIGEKVEKTAGALKEGDRSSAGECSLLQGRRGQRRGVCRKVSPCGGCLRERRLRSSPSCSCSPLRAWPRLFGSAVANAQPGFSWNAN